MALEKSKTRNINANEYNDNKFQNNRTLERKKTRRKQNRKERMKLKKVIEQSTKPESCSNKRKRLTNSDPEGLAERKRLRKDLKFLLNADETTSEIPPVFGILNDEEKKIIKKLLIERNEKRQNRPHIELTETGKAADLLTSLGERIPIVFDDFQHLILYSLHHRHSLKGFSKIVCLSKPEKLKCRIFLIIEGAGMQDYVNNEDSLTTLNQFETRLEVTSPLSYGGDLVEELALIPLSKNQRSLLVSNCGSLQEAMNAGEVLAGYKTFFQVAVAPGATIPLPGTDKFSRKELLLTPWEMVEEGYPLPGIDKFENFVQTRDEYTDVSANSPMWSIDCEMCQTKEGSELTWICIVNETHDVVYESLVKPHNKIINYVTEFSGITAEMLAPIKVRLEDVQEHIRSICPPDCIFVGQSLQFDLKAMKMIHPFVIDTSIIFNLSGSRHRKTKLRVLTEEFLSERIQQENKVGHSPIEDALAALKLVQVKLQHCLSWGNAVLSGNRPDHEREAARQLLAARDAAGTSTLKGHKAIIQSNSGIVHSQSILKHLSHAGRTVALVGKESFIDKWSQCVKNIQDVNEIVLSKVPTNKAAIKVGRSLEADVTIIHISLSSEDSLTTVLKADKLAGKLLKKTEANNLYSIFLAGTPGSPGNGLLFLHLFREHVPFVTLPNRVQ